MDSTTAPPQLRGKRKQQKVPDISLQQQSEGRGQASVTQTGTHNKHRLRLREHSCKKADHKQPVEDNLSWQGCSRMQAGPTEGSSEDGAFRHTGLIRSTHWAPTTHSLLTKADS